ncbi:hypothetical protein ACFW2D_18035 [Streptomyces sp. NPDC058914]|uniref:hypothetical protein n=1 Tax=Streptomyces sp. NPDC058914 TaxID=3346671 RepID=UPI00367B3D7A
MTAYWPIALTGGLGIAGTLAGTLGGLFVGRRQTTDQANVEHQQWLRGQRQEAYLQLLDAWDATTEALEDLVDRWEGIALRADEEGQTDEFEQLMDARVRVAAEGLEKPCERAHLLGPESVEKAVDALTEWVDHVASHLHQQAQPGAGTGPAWDWSTFQAFVARGEVLRMELVRAAKTALLTPPAPGG